MNYAMSQRHIRNTLQIKKLSSESSGKGHTSPDKYVAGKGFFSKHEMPISFQASVTPSQDNFFEILCNYGMILIIKRSCSSRLYVTVRAGFTVF